MSTLHTPELHSNSESRDDKDAAKIGICMTFHGQQRKSDGTLNAESQAFMLSAGIRRLLAEEQFPLILSGVLASPLNYPEGKAQDEMLRLWKDHHWISTTEDLGHQEGAMQTIFNGLRCASALGLDWLFVTAEDVLFESVNPVRETYTMARTAGVEYLSRPWLDDIGIYAVGTQVFICRIRPLMDPERNWYPWHRDYFNGYRGIEHYTVQTLINHGIPYLRTADLEYFHTHDVEEYKAHLSRFDQRGADREAPANPFARIS